MEPGWALLTFVLIVAVGGSWGWVAVDAGAPFGPVIFVGGLLGFVVAVAMHSFHAWASR
jgi:hypothetical protein